MKKIGRSNCSSYWIERPDVCELNKIYNMDCIEGMKQIDDNSIDAIVTDPPYELGFMGKQWDKEGIANNIEMWKESLRVLKPGAHLLSFGGSRTYHRMACATEDAGFEIRDQIMWVYGSGFPKSLNIGKAVDKLQGNKREITGTKRCGIADSSFGSCEEERKHIPETKGTSKWEGWGTSLKPSHEPIVVARKPLSEPNVALNVLKWGTGGINVDGCRVVGNEELGRNNNARTSGTSYVVQKETMRIDNSNGKRFPANLIHDGSDEVVELFPDSKSTGGRIGNKGSNLNMCGTDFKKGDPGFGNKGSASRFFYCAKASKAERDMGCKTLKRKEGGSLEGGADTRNNKIKTNQPLRHNNHPTVKPIALMQYLIKLITPPDGIVLDPFLGSGTTAIAAYKEHKQFIGFEKEKEYFDIAEARIKHYTDQKKVTDGEKDA